MRSRIRSSFSWCCDGVVAEGEHILYAIGLDGAKSMVDFLHRYVGASEMCHCLHADHVLHLVGDDFDTIVLPYFGPRVDDSKINSNG